MRQAATIVAAGLLFVACGRDETPTPKASAPGPTTAPAPAAAPAPTTPGAPITAPATSARGDPERGRQVYLAQCTACHNRDPVRDGPLGPAVKGSSPDLVEARVVRGSYPPGYTPKRPSKVMPARPDLTPELPDLTAYLR